MPIDNDEGNSSNKSLTTAMTDWLAKRISKSVALTVVSVLALLTSGAIVIPKLASPNYTDDARTEDVLDSGMSLAPTDQDVPAELEALKPSPKYAETVENYKLAWKLQKGQQNNLLNRIGFANPYDYFLRALEDESVADEKASAGDTEDQCKNLKQAIHYYDKGLEFRGESDVLRHRLASNRACALTTIAARFEKNPDTRISKLNEALQVFSVGRGMGGFACDFGQAAGAECLLHTLLPNGSLPANYSDVEKLIRDGFTDAHPLNDHKYLRESLKDEDMVKDFFQPLHAMHPNWEAYIDQLEAGK